jgi:hypothetical protein
MKFPSGVTFDSSVSSPKADEKLHSLSQNQQSRSDGIVSMLQHSSQDCSAVDRSSARSIAVVRIVSRNGTSFNCVSLTLARSHILNHFKFQNADDVFQRTRGESSADVDGCCSRLYPFCTRSTCHVHRDTTISLGELSKFIVDRFTSRLCPLWPRSEDPGDEEL